MRRRSIIFVLASLVATLLPAATSGAQAAGIAFINPSGYTSATQPRLLSGREDADATYHLVAWVKNPPADPLVEFELRPTATGNPTTVTATRVGTNTWEHDLDLAPIPDGSYTLQAILYSGTSPAGEDNEIVSVSNHELPPPEPARAVELLQPENGGRAGYFTPPGKASGFLVSAMASAGTSQVRFLYTLSDPGNEPDWKQCGSGQPNADRIVIARCALASGDSPAEVGAIAAVSNQTPPGANPQAAADETGDAHTVIPYQQTATTIDVDPEATSKDPGMCQKFTVTVTDQQSRPIAGMNVDVHAVGPSDQLQFATMDTTPVSNETDPFQAPDKAHSTENALRCSNDDALGRQGETNRPGDDDEKHIESTIPTNTLGGTDNTGKWDFALHSAVIGPTVVTAWGDSNDDDLRGSTEATGGAQLGWGQAPPQPVDEVTLSPSSATATVGDCAAFEVLARRGTVPIASANIDVHLNGPDTGVMFCDVTGGSSRRDPEAGGHTTGTHTDGVRHAEGEADAGGRFVFGVRSTTPGTTQVSIWYDSTEDDTLGSGEPTRSATVTWQPESDRTISLGASRSRVPKGRRVRLFGRIDGSASCSAAQTVAIESKPLRGGTFTTAKTVTTDDSGNFSTRVRMRKAKRFRASVPDTGACSAAMSGTVTVRVRS